MVFNSKIGVLFLIALGASIAFTATANASQQWDVPDYTALSVKATTAPIDTDEFLAALAVGFDDMDTNGDGKVSYAEAVAANPGLTQSVFDAVDTNGDGFISKAEAGLGGCGCGAVDWSDPAALVLGLLAFLGLLIGWACSGC